MTDSPRETKEKPSSPRNDSDHPAVQHPPGENLPLVLGALGVVFGDIGTSPLYAVKECFHGTHAIALSEANILGVLSLVFWSLTVVISVKYVTFLLRADHKGEGGIFVLLALTLSGKRPLSPRLNSTVVLASLLGAALLYGDGIITPAISVLSAVEGLGVATREAQPLILPFTCLILLLLFLFQYRGTANIGRIFGPIMLIWFSSIAALGIKEILINPEVLRAANPLYAYEFFVLNKLHGFIVLGSVVLCITGGEALYADLGHFGRRAIRLSWLGVAFPALLLNYFGQGSLLLTHPEMAFNPFYGLVPRWLLYPMVGLSTVATIIASQAMISGVFSLTQQAIQLGFCPRMRIIHTSQETRGQIYMPGINYSLMFACIGAVLFFKDSSGLAGAYGVAVTSTMGLTSVMYLFVLLRAWDWPLWKALPLVGLFLMFDLSYFIANIPKIPYGGWFPIIMGGSILAVMATWKEGRNELSRMMLSSRFPLDQFLEELSRSTMVRVPGTAVFMTISPVGTPSALLHHVKHNRMLHDRVILLTVKTIDNPKVLISERLSVEDLGQGFYRIQAAYGFMEKPSVSEIFRLASRSGLRVDPAISTFVLGRETLLTTGRGKMMEWRKHLFAFMSRNAQTATLFFGIPPGRVIEIGIQIEL
ncbi:MAG: potassium transporter Kup [Syntrophaceae bacterium]|nr:potassium transporter Kup [Syntrophaceae bacterium]